MNWQKLKNHDWMITTISLILMGLGLAIIYSTTYNATSAGEGAGTLPKQIIFIIVGLIIYFGLSVIDLTWLQIPGVMAVIYTFTIGILVYVILFGTVIAGTNRWISIGFFSLQPAEYAKIVIILLTASIFAHRQELKSSNYFKFAFGRMDKLIGDQRLVISSKAFLKSYPLIEKFLLNAVLIIPIVFLIFIQPAFGNSVIAILVWLTTIFIVIPKQGKTIAFLGLIAICLITYLQVFNIQFVNNDFVIAWARDGGWGMAVGLLGMVSAYLIVAWIGKFDWRLLAILPLVSLLVLLFGLFAWNNYVRDYQKQRVLTYLQGPGANYNNEGYQISQSVVAIGSGRLFGRGYLLGVQSGLKYLPEAHTDFIFAAYVEQFGLVGALVLFFLYLFLILRVVRISRESAGDFGRIFALGTAILLLLHVFISVGMNLGQLPVTGIPLPLMSYGGSAVLMIMICLGLVQAVNSNRKAVDIADDSMLLSRSLLLKSK